MISGCPVINEDSSDAFARSSDTGNRLRDRFDGSTTPLTLDGLAYAQGTTYRDVEGQIDLESDLEGIRWLRENVAGSPLVLEANTPTYRWGGRVSIHTGLPGVVGWEWQQQQQRWDYRSDVTKRIRDDSTPSPSEATALIERYGLCRTGRAPLLFRRGHLQVRSRSHAQFGVVIRVRARGDIPCDRLKPSEEASVQKHRTTQKLRPPPH